MRIGNISLKVLALLLYVKIMSEYNIYSFKVTFIYLNRYILGNIALLIK